MLGLDVAGRYIAETVWRVAVSSVFIYLEVDGECSLSVSHRQGHVCLPCGLLSPRKRLQHSRRCVASDHCLSLALLFDSSETQLCLLSSRCFTAVKAQVHKRELLVGQVRR